MCVSPSIVRDISTTSSAKRRVVSEKRKYWKTCEETFLKWPTSHSIAAHTLSKNRENNRGEHGHPCLRPNLTLIDPNSAPLTYTDKLVYNCYSCMTSCGSRCNSSNSVFHKSPLSTVSYALDRSTNIRNAG
jgi:hypothetical protein